MTDIIENYEKKLEEANSNQITKPGVQKYEQTHHLTNHTTYKIKNDIWDGNIASETQDKERLKDLQPVDLMTKKKNIMQGRNVSGCIWKKGTSTRASAQNKGRIKKEWDKKMEQRQRRKALQ